MSSALISIVCPVYNAEKYLSETLDSVLKQDYAHWELLLIDDGSSDNSAQIIAEYAAKDARITYIKMPSNQGVAAARNKGLDLAQGTYIAFIDSDDVWKAHKLSTQLAYMQKQDADLSHTAYQKVNLHGTILQAHIPVSESVNYQQLLKHNQIGLSTAMVKAKYVKNLRFEKIGHEDYVFWLKLLKLVKQSKGINQVLSIYRSRPGSLSHNKWVSAGYTWKIYRQVEQLNVFQSFYNFMCYCFYAGRKYLIGK